MAKVGTASSGRLGFILIFFLLRRRPTKEVIPSPGLEYSNVQLSNPAEGPYGTVLKFSSIRVDVQCASVACFRIARWFPGVYWFEPPALDPSSLGTPEYV